MSDVQLIQTAQQAKRPRKPVPSYLKNIEQRNIAATAFIQENEIHIQHIKNDDHPKGGITIAYQHKGHQSFITVATQICSDNDMFNCRTGRVLAVENFVSGKTICLPYKKSEDGSLNWYVAEMLGSKFKERYDWR